MENKKRIVCIGGANIDRKVKLSGKVQYHTSNPAKTSVSSGGVARNVAENLARLGNSVSLVTLFGEDQDHEQLSREMQELGIDCQLSRTLPGKRTGNYICINDPQGEMILATADMEIFEYFSWSWLEGKWEQIAAAEWVFLDANLPTGSLDRVIQKAAQDQINLCVDPVSAPKAVRLPRELRGVELLLPDISEAEALTGIAWQGKKSCEKIKEQLVGRGVKKLVISMGPDGVFAATGKESRYLPADSVPVKDVTGAGDAMTAGILWGLCRNLSFFEACLAGIRTASLTVQTQETVFSGLTPELLSTPTPLKGDH